MSQNLNPPSKDANLRGAISPFQKGMALLDITRPINCVITFLSVLLGGWLGTLTVSHNLLLAALSATLITAGGNVLNDVCGITEDRINKPHRPLPSCKLSQSFAIAFTVLLLFLGLAIGLTLPTLASLIALTAIIGLVTYNLWLKRVPLIGNLLVSALGGLAFLYGGFAVQTHLPARWPALFATLFHFGREILKDLEDIPGDQALTGSTIPLSWGKQTARLLITFTFCLLVLLTPLPAIVDIYGHVYFVLVCLLNILLIYVLIRLFKADTSQTLTHLNHVLKAGMLLGLCAFFFDRL